MQNALSASYDNKNAGENKTITYSLAPEALTGNDAGNYTVSAPDSITDASITKKSVEVGGIKASNKEYDGTTTATIDASKAVIVGKISTDNLTINATGSFADAEVADGKKVTLQVALAGDDKDNYEIATNPSQLTTTANITKAKAKVDLKANDLTYDGSEQELATAKATPADAQLLWYEGPEAPKDDKEWSTTAPKAKDAGTYIIWCKAKVTDEQSNYVTGDPTSAKVTIAPVALTVKADAQSKLEGEADPALTYQVSGLKGSDKRDAVVSGALTRDAGEAPGTYAIKQGGVKSTNPNYAIKYAGANLTINALPDTVAISPVVAHVQKVGWMGWAKNGEYAGTAGMSRRCETYQVVVVKKGAPAPGATYRGVTQDTDQAYISRG